VLYNSFSVWFVCGWHVKLCDPLLHTGHIWALPRKRAYNKTLCKTGYSNSWKSDRRATYTLRKTGRIQMAGRITISILRLYKFSITGRGQKAWKRRSGNSSPQRGTEVELCSGSETQPQKLKTNITRCSAIAERPRCRVRYSFRQK